MPSYCLVPVNLFVSHKLPNPLLQELHEPQLATKERIHLSPLFRDFTFSPTSSIIPAPSCPTTIGIGKAVSPFIT